MIENESEKDACYWTIIVRARDVFTTKTRVRQLLRADRPTVAQMVRRG